MGIINLKENTVFVVDFMLTGFGLNRFSSVAKPDKLNFTPDIVHL